jgi:Tfp pilus assembly protein PilP
MRALIAIFIVAMTPVASAQAPQPAPVPPPPQEGAPAPPPDYAYTPDGRRDPFVSLVNRGTEAAEPQMRGVRPEGVPGLLIDEVAIRGVVESRDGFIAMIAAPNGRTYNVRAGDRLMDGSVRTITTRTVVFMQEVNDPLSLEKQREVRKPLRPEVK